jgi:hypothetical protein
MGADSLRRLHQCSCFMQDLGEDESAMICISKLRICLVWPPECHLQPRITVISIAVYVEPTLNRQLANVEMLQVRKRFEVLRCVH